MPVDDVAPRLRELGRLKFGEDLGDRPTQLETWRLTSDNVDLLDAAAQLYGGTVTRTERGGTLTTEASALDVLLPAQDLEAGQWYELWTAGGLQRRCTGSALVEFDNASPEGFRKVGPCICEDENRPTRACKVTTVLRVLLPQLPDLGVWRLVTRSAYAAAELPVSAQALTAMTGQQFAPAVLSLDRRTAKRPGEGPQHFVVPVLGTSSTVAGLMADQALGITYGAEQGGPLGPGDKKAALPSTAAPTSEPSTRQIDTIAAQPAESGPVLEPPPLHRPEPPPSDSEPSSSVSRFAALAGFLAETTPDELPATAEGLLETLAALETLMAEARLWTTDALDQAASRRLPAGVDWRKPGEVMTPALRTFAKRALMAASAELNNHPDGYTAARQAERTNQ